VNNIDKKLNEKPRELIFHNIHDHGTEIVDMWMNEVEARTRTRVKFTKSTGENQRLIAAADVVRDVPVMSSRYPLLNLVQIPFVFPSATVGSRVIAQLYSEFSELRDELSDTKIVGIGTGALMAIFSSRAWGPIRTLEDFKGARTRSLLPIDRFMTALGAKPIHVGYLEISHLLGTGQLDAAVLGILPSYMFRLAEGAAPYCTLAGDYSITMHPIRIYMKWDTWNKLPPDIQRVIEEIGPADSDCWYAVHSGMDADNNLLKAKEYIKQKGELFRVTPEELKRWRQSIQITQDSIMRDVEAKGLPGRRFLKRMNELVAEYD
jgi:TRAP-type C4-dicarboxylate transport system substrate-binding protein